MADQPHVERRPLAPIGRGQSILLFGIPAAILVAFVYLVIPALDAAGLSPFMAYLVGLLIPLVLMFLAALAAYRLEGSPLTWNDFKARYRLRPMTGRDWLWTLGLAVFSVVAYGILLSIESALITGGLIPLPAGIPAALDPRTTSDPASMAALLDGQLQGSWTALIVYFVLLFFNIFGEELWWRGFILPRQELAFGKTTWLIHGSLWALFHIFKWWDVVALLPVTLSLSFVAQRRQNTWPGIICHYVTNGLGFIGFALVVAGVVKL